MQALRTEENKTVLDKGITTIRETNGVYYGRNVPSRQTGNEFNYINPNPLYTTETSDFEVLRYYSPKTLFTKTYLNGTHLKIEALNWFEEYKDLDFFTNRLVVPINDTVGNGHIDL